MRNMQRRSYRSSIMGLIFLILSIISLFAIGYIVGYSVGEKQAKIVEKEVIKYIEVEKEVETPETSDIDTLSTPEQNEKCLGEFVLTAYCPCNECSAGYGRATATGAVATAGRTVAVDPSVIPYGTKLIINGHTYIAEDCGGAVKGNVIDIFFDTHSEVNAFGKQTAMVYAPQ